MDVISVHMLLSYLCDSTHVVGKAVKIIAASSTLCEALQRGSIGEGFPVLFSRHRTLYSELADMLTILHTKAVRLRFVHAPAIAPDDDVRFKTSITNLRCYSREEIIEFVNWQRELGNVLGLLDKPEALRAVEPHYFWSMHEACAGQLAALIASIPPLEPGAYMAAYTAVHPLAAATTICPFFLERRCRYGAHCPNVHPLGLPGLHAPHVPAALPSASMLAAPAAHASEPAGPAVAGGAVLVSAAGAAGVAAGATASAAPPPSARAVYCRFFAAGTCTQGASCKYIHGTPAESAARAATGSATAAAAASAAAGGGGPTCRFWLTNSCRNGAACRFKHG